MTVILLLTLAGIYIAAFAAVAIAEFMGGKR